MSLTALMLGKNLILEGDVNFLVKVAATYNYGLWYTTQSSMAISLFTVRVPIMIGICQVLSVLISFVVFSFLVGYLPFIFSIFLHGYNNLCSNFINF